MFVWFIVRVFLEFPSVSVCVSFPFGFEGGMLDLIVLFPVFAFLFTFHW